GSFGNSNLAARLSPHLAFTYRLFIYAQRGGALQWCSLPANRESALRALPGRAPPLAEPRRALHISGSTPHQTHPRNGFMIRISLFIAALCCATPAFAQEEAIWMRYPAISPDGSTLV